MLNPFRVADAYKSSGDLTYYLLIVHTLSFNFLDYPNETKHQQILTVWS